MQSYNKNEKKKHNYQKTQYQLKTTYPFIKGIPPASNWSNHFTSLIFPGGKYLTYISNSFIIVLDLIKKNFSQILSSYKISPKEKPNIIILLNKEKFLSVISSGDIIIFGLNNEGNFVEEIKTNKCDKVCLNAKYGVFDNEQNLLILSNDDKIFVYYLHHEEIYSANKLYEILNVDGIEYFITDMLLIKMGTNNYLVVSNNIGNIIIYKYDTIKYEQILIINSNKKENIYNIIYNKIENLLVSINKSGTLNIYKLSLSNNNILEYNNIITLTNKFNDQSIKEFYLYFSISFIKENITSFILVTSNQGRIFLYNIKNNEFKEIAENPHKNSIYSILINNQNNQVIFISSDYKISLFDIKYKDISQPSLNFVNCINTIPSKTKLLKQYNNKIFYLYQIQHQLYINRYDIKKEINCLDSLQNKLKIKNNINNENNLYNYNLTLCQLIGEERILLINKMNEIIIYNIENDEIEYNFLFLKNDDLIIDIIYNTDILYILYKSGKLIIYNIETKKIEKYKISNIIEKANLLYIQNNIILIIIKENKSEVVQFYIFKNFIFIKLKGLIVPNEYFSYIYKISNLNIFYFYASGDNLAINYINIFKQYEILKNVDCKEIKYEQYLEIIDKLKDSLKYLNEKKYVFDSIFQRNDVNLRITNIAINENLNMICSFSDGSVMYYIINIDSKYPNNYIINKIIYKYLIKVNFLLINDAIFINNENNKTENNYSFVTTSAEQSLKIIDPSNCNILNINFKPNLKNKSNSFNIEQVNNNYIINKSFTNLFSNYFFTQSMKEAKIFSENFTLPDNINNTSMEVLIYSYFNSEDKNISCINKIIEYARNKNKNKKESLEYIDEVCDYFSKKEKNNNKLIFGKEKDDNDIIDDLIELYCYVECLLYVKYKNLGLNIFVQCLEKIKKSIYLKQIFQVTKIENIIQYYKANFNIICE